MLGKIESRRRGWQREAWHAAVHGITKSWPPLSDSPPPPPTHLTFVWCEISKGDPLCLSMDPSPCFSQELFHLPLCESAFLTISLPPHLLGWFCRLLKDLVLPAPLLSPPVLAGMRLMTGILGRSVDAQGLGHPLSCSASSGLRKQWGRGMPPIPERGLPMFEDVQTPQTLTHFL